MDPSTHCRSAIEGSVVFGKIFASMYEGSLCVKGPWEALVTFQQLIVIADKHGVVDLTAEAISRRTTIPLTIIEKGLRALEKPDPESRTPDEGGRRIVRLSSKRSWGWRIVNYLKYRDIRNQEARRDYHRQYWQEKRSPKGQTASRGTQHALNKLNPYRSNKQIEKQEKTPSLGESSKEDSAWIAANAGPSEFEKQAANRRGNGTATAH